MALRRTGDNLNQCWDIVNWARGNKFRWTLQCRHNERDDVSNHRRLYCLFNRLFRHRSKKTSKLCVTGLCEGNPPVTGGFPSQRASNAENVSIWWCHRDLNRIKCKIAFPLSSPQCDHSISTVWLLSMSCASCVIVTNLLGKFLRPNMS